ncbi:hypothetical protein V6N13_090934 [Hibiscus sabdariffa]|uniref:BZIP domain-containing protein n=1 Tax=Hibiscus sabdariffa TaxID=183260 RepID=A0ABR2PBH5_9ROSI
MASKFETSQTPNDKMLKPDDEKSSALNNGESTLSFQSKQSCRTSLNQRSGSDSITFVEKPQRVGSSNNGAAIGCLEINEGTIGDVSSASSLVTEAHHPTESGKWGQNFGPNMDPKKIKRILANRVAAQKSRLKKEEYIEKLKKEIATNQAKVAVLAPAVSFHEKLRMTLQQENDAMKQRMEFLQKEKAKKEAEYQALKDERDMLALTHFQMREDI